MDVTAQMAQLNLNYLTSRIIFIGFCHVKAIIAVLFNKDRHRNLCLNYRDKRNNVKECLIIHLWILLQNYANAGSNTHLEIRCTI